MKQRLITALKTAGWVVLHLSCGIALIAVSASLVPDARGALLGMISAVSFIAGITICSTVRWIVTGRNFLW